MPWLSRYEYQKLLRKANEHMLQEGKNGWKQNINDLGFLLWRLNPVKSNDLTDGMLWPNPFEHIDVYICGDKVFIFIVHDEKPLIFEDSHSLYPSDELVAKLRFLLK